MPPTNPNRSGAFPPDPNDMGVKVQKNPRSMAFIMAALGITGIGIVLCIAFFDNESLLIVGIMLALLGGGITVLGCIRMQSMQGGAAKRDIPPQTVAPPRIPPMLEHTIVYPDEALAYPACNTSPARGGYRAEAEAAPSPSAFARSPSGQIVPRPMQREMADEEAGTAFVSVTDVGPSLASGARWSRNTSAAYRGSPPRPMAALSPYEQRSFPVPRQARVTTATLETSYDASMNMPPQDARQQVARHRDVEADRAYHERQTPAVADEDALPEHYWSARR
jgi:hypothetical protein